MNSLLALSTLPVKAVAPFYTLAEVSPTQTRPALLFLVSV